MRLCLKVVDIHVKVQKEEGSGVLPRFTDWLQIGASASWLGREARLGSPYHPEHHMDFDMDRSSMYGLVDALLST